MAKQSAEVESHGQGGSKVNFDWGRFWEMFWFQLPTMIFTAWYWHRIGRRHGIEDGIQAGMEIGITIEREHIREEDISELVVNGIHIKGKGEDK